MTRLLKSPFEKLETKLSRALQNDSKIERVTNSLRVQGKILARFTTNRISYSNWRYYSSKKIDLVKEDYSAVFLLNHETIQLLSSNVVNPPKAVANLIRFVRNNTNEVLHEILVGSDSNSIACNQLSVTTDFFRTFIKINKEEGKDKNVRVQNRIRPFLKDDIPLSSESNDDIRDFALMLREVIASGEYTQSDLQELMNSLEPGDENKVVIEKTVNKQVMWLIDTIQQIVDEETLTRSRAKELGKSHFGFSKSEISGPEHLMEKILAKYGKDTLFGVPFLVNTNKYVSHAGGLSRSQFDLILINHLSDVEVVELKRPDAIVMDYDGSRGKFYASKDLSVAVSQAERYISAVYRENDDDYKINNQRIRDFLNDQIGDVMTFDICRPKAVIIIGNHQTRSKRYADLNSKLKTKVSKQDYELNCDHAYRELKEAFKNIQILTYSELLDSARTRFSNESDE